MALLHVEEVEPHVDREFRDRHVVVDQSLQLVVGDERVIGRDLFAGGFVRDRPRVEDRVVRRDDRARVAVPPGVRQLQPEQEVGVVAVGVAVRLAAVVHDARERRLGGLVQRDLSRGGAAGLRDGARLAPEQFRPARAEPHVAAEGEFARRAVEFAVAPFHRVNAPPVAGGAVPDGDGLKQGREVVGEAQVGAEPRVLGFQFRERLVLEELGHESEPGEGVLRSVLLYGREARRTHPRPLPAGRGRGWVLLASPLPGC